MLLFNNFLYIVIQIDLFVTQISQITQIWLLATTITRGDKNL